VDGDVEFHPVTARPTYTTYSIGCALVWGFILAMLGIAGNKEQLRKVLPVFGGWWIGWTSATIARYVYPPPRHRPAPVPSTPNDL